jgi:C_GCAxxG_C_C family probable redox protein
VETDKDLELHNRLGQKVKENLARCGNCAQTTFLSLVDEFNLEEDGILKALTPFPGIALRGETCGAVTGSLMMIGLILGRDREHLSDWQAYIKSLSPARKFCYLFESQAGGTACSEIVEARFGRKFDLADPNDAVRWFNCGALEKCGDVITSSVCITAQIIHESGEFSRINS